MDFRSGFFEGLEPKMLTLSDDGVDVKFGPITREGVRPVTEQIFSRTDLGGVRFTVEPRQVAEVVKRTCKREIASPEAAVFLELFHEELEGRLTEALNGFVMAHFKGVGQ